jgi:hypothetical protein
VLQLTVMLLSNTDGCCFAVLSGPDSLKRERYEGIQSA